MEITGDVPVDILKQKIKRILCTTRTQAFDKIKVFFALYQMERNMSIAGKSTLNNYTRHLAKLALHFNCMPTELDQVNNYLYLMQQQHKTSPI